MFKISSASVESLNSRRVGLQYFYESFPQMERRLMRAINCCETSRRSWQEFRGLVCQLALIPELKFYKIAPTLLGNISSVRKVIDGVHMGECIRRMKHDGSVTYLTSRGIREGNINSQYFLHNIKELRKLCAIFDEKSAPGAAEEFLCHFYLKVALGKLADRKFGDALMLQTLIHRDYVKNNNCVYPLLNPDGTEYLIQSIGARSCKRSGHKQYYSTRVKPFINPFLTAKQRGGLYDQLQVRLLGSEDLAEHDKLLEGQCGVFATRRIPFGTCVGVHGGTVLTLEKLATDFGISNDDFVKVISQSHMVGLGSSWWSSQRILLDGNNIISKINSIFHPAGDGCWKQAEGGYNVETVTFKSDMDDLRRIALPAIYTTRVIQPGEELRLNYRYCPALVTDIMKTEGIIAAAKREDLIQSILSVTIEDPDGATFSVNAQATAAGEVLP